jgi:hypothetical protein
VIVFKEKYIELKNQNLLSDIIFAKLQGFAGGAMRKPPKIESAVLAVLAFFVFRS